MHAYGRLSILALLQIGTIKFAYTPCQQTEVHTYTHIAIRTYMHEHMHAYIHTLIHTWGGIHTYNMQAYMHSGDCVMWQEWVYTQ